MGAASFLEDYQVYVSPTGGSAVANFTTLLIDVNNELSTGSFRTIPVQAYAGQSVRFAFRNDGNDQYVMFLDNISVVTSNLSTNDFIANKFTVSPNPTKSVVNVSNFENINLKSISIVDLNGRTVQLQNFENQITAQINIADLAAGMYLMNISSDQGSFVKKIVKE